MRGYYPGESGYYPGTTDPGGYEDPGPSRARRGVDWAVGITLGFVLGVAIVAAFLFLGSEKTIDGASISGVDTGQAPRQASPVTSPRSQPESAPRPAP